MIEARLPSFPTEELFEDSHIIHLIQELPAADANSVASIPQKTLDSILKKMGASNKDIEDMDVDTKITDYFDRLNEKKKAGNITMPSFLPTKPHIVYKEDIETVIDQMPGPGYRPTDDSEAVESVALQKAVLHSDGISEEVMYDPRYKNIYAATRILTNKSEKRVSTRIFRIKNTFLPLHALALQKDVPGGEEVLDDSDIGENSTEV